MEARGGSMEKRGAILLQTGSRKCKTAKLSSQTYGLFSNFKSVLESQTTFILISFFKISFNMETY